MYPNINFVLRVDSKLIKEMYEYSFLNCVYVNDDCIIFFMSSKESILAKQKILKMKKAIYENLIESNLPTYHEIWKLLKHQSSCGYYYERSKEESSEEDMSLNEELIISM